MLPDNNLHKFLEDDEDWDDEEKIIQGGHKLMSGPGIVTVDMKLFKEEIGEYDKKHHDTSDLRSMGTRTKLVQSWYNALSPSVLKELRQVADKWNQEGPHSDAKDRYHSQHQKKIMEDFIKMAGRTIGLHVVILAAHDRGEGKMPGMTIWESCLRKAKKTFTLALKENKKCAGESQDQLTDLLNEAEYGGDPKDKSDEDDEKGPDLMVQVNDEGYPCLLTGFESLILKNQQKVVQKVFQKAYVVISNNPHTAVSWNHITQDLDHYLNMNYIPQNVVIKDPSHLQKEAISMLFSLWKYCANHNKPIVRGYKSKSRKSQKYIKVSVNEDEVLKKTPKANLSSDEEEDLAIHASHTPSLPEIPYRWGHCQLSSVPLYPAIIPSSLGHSSKTF
ncbi:hypothetical protein EDB19DRAFT_1911771 [Suillus lakei]|nr:hypothetical protein EDB19DRAFT_1911771 [Suillus lakei]